VRLVLPFLFFGALVNGYEEGARRDAHNLGAEHLLPEERALIAPFIGD
jgi:hypothetical protein